MGFSFSSFLNVTTECEKVLVLMSVFPRKGGDGKSLGEEGLVWPTTFWNNEQRIPASISDNEYGCEFFS